MKQFASWFTHGVPGGSALRKSIFEAKNGPAVLASVEEFFERKALQPGTPLPAHESAPETSPEMSEALLAATCAD
jgi:hypothetical protein